MSKNHVSFFRHSIIEFLNFLQPCLHRFLFVMFILLQAISIFYATHSLNYITKPSEWYFWTEENSGPDRVQPNHKIILNGEINAPNALWTKDPLGVCDPQAIVALADRHINPAGVGYRDVWLCNNAKVAADEFDTQLIYFREKVDGLYSAYRGEVCSKILTSLACGFVGWLFIVFSTLTIKWIKGGKAG